MYSYITEELPATVFEAFKYQIDAERVSITGHSMGGHGALTLVRLPSPLNIVIEYRICADREHGKSSSATPANTNPSAPLRPLRIP